MNYWLLLLVLSFATFRLTRLITRDDFPPILWARTKIQHARPQRTVNGEFEWWWLGELVSCHWCASGWVSLAFVETSNIFASIPLPIFTWFAVWGIGAVLVDRLG